MAEIKQSKQVLDEIARLDNFFKTTPILIKEYKNEYMKVNDIPFFIESQLIAAASFSTKTGFNAPLKRLQDLELAIKNQLSTKPE